MIPFFFILRHKTDLRFPWGQSFTEWKLCRGIRKYNLRKKLIHSVTFFWFVLQCSFITPETSGHTFIQKSAWQYTSLVYTIYVLTGYVLGTINSSKPLAALKWFCFFCCFFFFSTQITLEVWTKLFIFSKGIPCALWLMISHINSLLHIH